MVDKKLQKLALAIALNENTTEYSMDDLKETFRAEVVKLVCNEEGEIDFYAWEQNKTLVFQLLSTTIDKILPTRVIQWVEKFAETKTYKDGDKPRFLVKKGKKNVKRFLTKVAAAGVYERVRLDRDYFDIETYAHGGAVYQTMEGFLAGRESITEVFDILLEALEDAVLEDITTALQGTLDSMPAANKHTHSAFSATDFNRILATVRAYGQPVIFCTQEFATSLVPESGFIGDADKADMRNQGYIGKYLGSDVIILPQSFTDETNTVKVIDPQFCYIMPSGSSEKPVKVGFEGTTKIRQDNNADWSTEIQMYKKMGIAIIHTNYFGIYRNTSLS